MNSACGLAVLIAAGTACADSESSIKVAMIYNLARYVTWPPADADPSAAEFRIGIAADARQFEEFASLEGKMVGGATIRIHRAQDADDLRGCRLVYIAAQNDGNTRRLLTAVAGTPTLTVSDTDGFARAGGMVELARLRNKVRLLVNPAVARASGLQLSSQLLKLATIVEAP